VLFRKNQVTEAITHFREALRLDPNLGAARYQLGLALTRAGQKEEGAKEIEQARTAIDTERKMTIAGQLMGEARAEVEAGKKDSAVDKLQQVIRLLPDYEPAREALQRLQTPAPSPVATAAPAVSAVPDDPGTVRLFEEYISRKQFRELEPLVVDYLAVNPKSWWAHYVLGYARFGQHRIGDSIASLAKSLELNVNNAEAHRLLGRTLMIIGRYDVARTELEMAAKLKPQWAEVRYDLGKVHSASDNYALAKRELQEAVRLAPDYMEAYEALGFVMEALSDDAAAIEHYKKSAQIAETRKTGFGAPYVSLAALYNRIGKPDIAAGYARQAIAMDANSDSGLFQLGKALDRQQQWPEAASALQRAVDANPNIASYHYVLSGVYRRLGKLPESQRHMETFRQLEQKAAEFEQKRREAQRGSQSSTAPPSPEKSPSPR
jgi:tetratricopeptide (TPR) repeat protein